MHESSFLKMRLFLETYRDQFAGDRPRILEIGSKRYHGQPAYRDLMNGGFEYVGLDMEPGENVDVVPDQVYLWGELEDRSFDVCISGQTFEHNPFFWVTMCEIGRILKPGGLCCVIAPGGGIVHRYPYDCWRFYPDSWAPLCKLAGLDILEAYFERDANVLLIEGGMFRDSCVIAAKPDRPEAEDAEFHRLLRLMTRHYTNEITSFEAQPDVVGRCFSAYERELQKRRTFSITIADLVRRITRRTPVSVFKPHKSL